MMKLLGFLKRYSANTSGATAVEFGLVAMPFFLMIFGVMEAGRMMWTMNGVQYAVEQTTRYASMNSSAGESSFRDYAQTKLSEMMVPSSNLQISSTTVNTGGVNFVQIDGQYQHRMLIGAFIPENGFGDINITSSVKKPIVN